MSRSFLFVLSFDICLSISNNWFHREVDSDVGIGMAGQSSDIGGYGQFPASFPDGGEGNTNEGWPVHPYQEQSKTSIFVPMHQLATRPQVEEGRYGVRFAV